MFNTSRVKRGNPQASMKRCAESGMSMIDLLTAI
jgi:hypothetical protein